MTERITLDDLKLIRDTLVGHYNLEELKDLAFDLSIDYAHLANKNRETFAIELIEYCRTHDQIPTLIHTINKARPHSKINALASKVPDQPMQRVKLHVIVGEPIAISDAEIEAAFKKALSDLLNVDSNVINLTTSNKPN